MKSRLFVTAFGAALFCAPASAATPTATGPWGKVPALPTACYSEGDPWWEQNDAAFNLVQQEHYRQNDINDAIRQNSTDTMEADPMAVADRLQQKMMDDPANAQKYMEEMQQQNQQAKEETPVQQEKEKQLEAESKRVMKQYQAALAKAMGPAEARWTALKKKMGIPMDSISPGEMGVPDWAWKEWYGILKDRDTAYVANCAQWWNAGGPVHAYMKRYKDYLVLERVPYEKKFLDEPKLERYKTMNVSTRGWRTTTDYEAAEDYMKMARVLFGERQVRPACSGSACPK
jgi:hypothetical protein